ncbi:MAG: DUF2141 domain-containing protein [Flavobacteriales bacterium]|nr:DUF2141 domain-containing protein [Flavobacteriales bacterium]
MIGWPQEPYGFSNDAPVNTGPPSFRLAVFEVKEKEMTTRIALRRSMQELLWVHVSTGVAYSVNVVRSRIPRSSRSNDRLANKPSGSCHLRSPRCVIVHPAGRMTRSSKMSVIQSVAAYSADRPKRIVGASNYREFQHGPIPIDGLCFVRDADVHLLGPVRHALDDF